MRRVIELRGGCRAEGGGYGREEPRPAGVGGQSGRTKGRDVALILFGVSGVCIV